MTVTSSAATSTMPTRPKNSRMKKPLSTLRRQTLDVKTDAAQKGCGERDAKDA